MREVSKVGTDTFWRHHTSSNFTSCKRNPAHLIRKKGPFNGGLATGSAILPATARDLLPFPGFVGRAWVSYLQGTCASINISPQHPQIEDV